jgi:hypothetical protein
MPQHGRITAHWNLDSRQQEGRERAIATEGRTCSAKTRGKADQKRGLALGHITTEQKATDPAESARALNDLFSKTGHNISILVFFGCALGPREIDVLRERLKLEVDLST